MSILIDRNTRLIVQGITGRDGSFHTFHIDAEVHDLAHLHAIIAALREADPVSSVERI